MQCKSPRFVVQVCILHSFDTKEQAEIFVQASHSVFDKEKLAGRVTDYGLDIFEHNACEGEKHE